VGSAALCPQNALHLGAPSLVSIAQRVKICANYNWHSNNNHGYKLMFEFINKFSEKEIQFLAMSAQALAAFGTFFAAVVALHIAKYKPQMKITMSISYIVDAQGNSSDEFICYSIKNCGNMPEEVTSLYYKIRFTRKRYHIDSHGLRCTPSQMPILLNPGLEFKLFLPMNIFINNHIESLKKIFPSSCFLEKISAYVHIFFSKVEFTITRIDKPISCRFSQALRRIILSELFK
jgi:hypothetical protein